MGANERDARTDREAGIWTKTDVTTTLLPLAKCYKLKKLRCYGNAMYLEELREIRPDINSCV